MIHKNLLKILFVEDLPSDVDLAVLELRKEKLKFEHTTICTRADLIKALSEFKPDLIISDYMMPAFNGMQALKEVKEFNPEIPFILCTGSINEETAVECLKAGADDYIIKEHLTRLPFAVKEALEQHMIQVEKRAAELLLKENEEKLQSIFRVAPVGMGLVVDRVIIEVNDTFCKMTGYDREELIGNTTEMVIPTREEYEFISLEEKRLIAEKGIAFVESRLKCKDGRILNIISGSTPLDVCDLSKGLTFTVLDITERKRAEENMHIALTKYKTLFECFPLGVTVSDEAGNIVETNSTAEMLLGVPHNEQIQRDIDGPEWHIIQTDGTPMPPEKYASVRALKQRCKVENVEMGIVKSDNTITWINVTATPIPLKGYGVVITYNDISERKQAEDKLQETNEYLTNLFNHANAPIIVWDTSLCITRFNNALEHLSGYGAEEVIGKKVEVLFPKEKIESSLDLIKRTFSGERWENVEIELQRKDGDSRIVLWNSANILDKDDKTIVATIAQGNDITERMLAEDKLRSSEERLKILFDYAPDAYYLNDLKGNFIDGNIAAEKLLGHDRNELIGKSFLKLNILSLKQIPRAAKLLVKNALGQGTGPDEFELNQKDGSKVTVEIITHPVKIKDKTLVLGLARNISERKRAEEALRQSEEKYRRIFENVQDVFYELSIRGKILETSPSIEILSKGQFKRDDLIGKSMYDFYPDPTERRTLLNVLRERGFVSDFEINLKNRDGSSIPCSVSSRICFDAQGRPEKIIGSMRDITDRKKASDALKFAKEKAEANDKLKTTFLNNISHEVRTPLNGILGFAEIMSHADLSEEEKKVSLSMLFESSDRLLNTITNYMDISMITSGTMSLYKKDFLPEQVLREILEKNKVICSVKNIDLSLKIPEQDEKLSIRSDPGILRKIISHLLNNAIKFTEKGSIDFGYKIHRNELEFFVKDTGIGIGTESLKDIFERFVKEDRGPLKITEGSGLGLSISKGLVELLGGKIWVESENGKGSSFFFTVPVEKEFENHIISQSAVKQKRNKTIYSILVAEDDEINFFYLKALLSQNTTAEVIHASNGMEALEIFQKNPHIGLILMDIKMPVMDGLEATRQIKAINRNIPVIAITAYAMAGDEARIAEAGCDYCLTKPINKELLLEKISEFVKIKSVLDSA